MKRILLVLVVLFSLVIIPFSFADQSCFIDGAGQITLNGVVNSNDVCLTSSEQPYIDDNFRSVSCEGVYRGVPLVGVSSLRSRFYGYLQSFRGGSVVDQFWADMCPGYNFEPYIPNPGNLMQISVNEDNLELVKGCIDYAFENDNLGFFSYVDLICQVDVTQEVIVEPQVEVINEMVVGDGCLIEGSDGYISSINGVLDVENVCLTNSEQPYIAGNFDGVGCVNIYRGVPIINLQDRLTVSLGYLNSYQGGSTPEQLWADACPGYDFSPYIVQEGSRAQILAKDLELVKGCIDFSIDNGLNYFSYANLNCVWDGQGAIDPEPQVPVVVEPVVEVDPNILSNGCFVDGQNWNLLTNGLLETSNVCVANLDGGLIDSNVFHGFSCVGTYKGFPIVKGLDENLRLIYPTDEKYVTTNFWWNLCPEYDLSSYGSQLGKPSYVPVDGLSDLISCIDMGVETLGDQIPYVDLSCLGEVEPEVVIIPDIDSDGIADEVDICPNSRANVLGKNVNYLENGCAIGDVDRNGCINRADVANQNMRQRVLNILIDGGSLQNLNQELFGLYDNKHLVCKNA